MQSVKIEINDNLFFMSNFFSLSNSDTLQTQFYCFTKHCSRFTSGGSIAYHGYTKDKQNDLICFFVFQQCLSVCRRYGKRNTKGAQGESVRAILSCGKSRSRELGGVGLGLALVNEIVRVHDGSICIKSGKTGGTIFEVTFAQHSMQRFISHLCQRY